VLVSKLSITFEEILSLPHGNFEVQNKVLDPSVVIINYCIIIIIIIIIINADYIFFPVVLRPNAGHSLLILEVSRSHTTTHHSR